MNEEAMTPNKEHAATCSIAFARDATTGEGICDCGVAFREEEHRAYVARHHTGKRPYESKAEARRIAGMTTARFGGRRKEPYRCEVCDSWHVGEER